MLSRQIPALVARYQAVALKVFPHTTATYCMLLLWSLLEPIESDTLSEHLLTSLYTCTNEV